MDLGRFGASPIGRLVPIRGEHLGRNFEHFAFVPVDLPHHIGLEDSTLLLLTEAVSAVARLDGAGRRLPYPDLLVRQTMRREAVSTSALEGTYTTLPEVLRFELFEEEDSPSRDVDEVLSYVRASEYGYGRLHERPVSLNLIKEIHGILVKNDPEIPDHEKGEFRQRQNFVGPKDGRVEDSFFVPPPPSELIGGLHAWENWVHRIDLPILLRCAVGHYQFETLHPFVDGNGRIGRLIVGLMLVEDGMLSVPLLTISPYLEARRDEYQQRLRDLSMDGNFDAWVAFFLQAIKSSAEQALDKSERLLALREEMVAVLRAKRIRGSAIQATEDLIGNPVVSPSRMASQYDITYQAAAYTIEKMVAAGVLEQVETGSRRVLYASPRVMAILI